MAQRDFPFIVSDGPRLPKDPKVRTAIRKQAMRDVAVARRKRNARSDNSTSSQDGQLVDSSEDATTSSSSSDSKSASPDQASLATSPGQELVLFSDPSPNADYEQWFVDDVTSSLRLMSPITPYESVRARYQIDIQDLSVLTNFNISNLTVTSLADVNNLKALLEASGPRVFTYLAFVPSRYGISQCVTAAVDCILSKVASRLDSLNRALEARALSLYQKALSAVQKAVSCPKEACSADTLCAVSLLSMHELLDPNRLRAWQHHVDGSANIIRHRKAVGFDSQYEKALLYAHLGPAVTEALSRFEYCYLDAPEWHAYILSFAEDTTWLTNRSPLTVRMRINEVVLPGAIRAVHDAYMDDSIFDPTSPAQITLRKRVRKAHDEMIECLDDYKAHLVQTSLLQPPEDEITMRRELFGGALECLCVYKRLLGALYEDHRLDYELETRALALLLKDLQNKSSGKHDWLFSGHELGVVRCVEVCGARWREDVSNKTQAEQKKLAVDRWLAFTTALTQWED